MPVQVADANPEHPSGCAQAIRAEGQVAIRSLRISGGGRDLAAVVLDEGDLTFNSFQRGFEPLNGQALRAPRGRVRGAIAAKAGQHPGQLCMELFVVVRRADLAEAAEQVPFDCSVGWLFGPRRQASADQRESQDQTRHRATSHGHNGYADWVFVGVLRLGYSEAR